MVVELRSLRITSDFDASRYVAGMNQKDEADRIGAQSSRAAGQAVEDLKIKVSSAVPLIERLSRTYVDGYGTAAKFNTEVMRLARSQDTHAVSVEHLEQVYTGLQRKFGLVADATELAARGYTGLATAIENVNSRLNQTDTGQAATALAARIEQLRTQFDPAYVAAQRLSSELNDLAEAERLGVQITGGYERALEALTLKHDAAAAAAKRQRDEYSRLAQEAREAAAADRAQAAFNERFGVFNGTGLRASDSAAVFTEQMSRQEEIARLRAQQQASNFADDLNRRFFSGSGTSAQASAGVFSAEFARMDELARLRAQQQGSAFSSDLNERLGVNGFGTSARASAAAFEEAARAAEQLDRKAALLRAQIDPLGAAQNRLNAELAEYEDLARRNAISSDELGRAQLMARKRYDDYSTEINRSKKRGVGGLASYELTNLMYQGTDVVQSLALGMPIQQVFLQQGPQIAQIFAANSAGAKGFIASLGATTVALTGTVAAAALGVKAWSDYLRSTKEVETAAAGLGRAVAGSSAEMEASAEAGAAASGISVRAARSMEVQFLRTGRIGSEHYERLISVSKDFAATIGVDSASVGATLSQMFADPASAADELYRKYGLINSATARHVADLAAQNRVSEAQGVLLDALPDKLARAEEATTKLGRAWRTVSTWASNAYDAMGKAVSGVAEGPSLEERFAIAQREYERFSNQGWIQTNLNGAGDRAARARNELEVVGEEMRRRAQAEFQSRRDAEDRARSVQALSYAEASPANADEVRRRALENSIESMRSNLTNRQVSAEERKSLTAAIEAQSNALDGLINKQARAIELDRLDIQIANERNPLLRADLEARRTRMQLSDQELSQARIEEEVARVHSRVLEESIASSAALARDMQVEAQERSRLNALVASGTITSADANRMLQEELQLRPLIAAAAMAETTAKGKLEESIAALRKAYADLAASRRDEAATGILRGQSERLATLDAELRLVEQTEAARRRALAVHQADQQIARDGIDPSGDHAGQIRTNAASEAEKEVRLRNLQTMRDMRKDQAERAAMTQTELALVGQSEAVRRRTLAIRETELRLIREGISLEDAKAKAIIAGEAALADQTAALQRQNAAWDKVRGSAENTIDTLVGQLTGGDIEGALEGIAKDWTKTLLTLGVANPAKNGLLGTDHETMDDIGGFSGLVSRLFGGGDQTVGAMTVSAGTVMVNGGIAGGLGEAGDLIGKLTGTTGSKAANDNSNVVPLSGGVGKALDFVGNYKSGVDQRLTDILQKAAKSFPGFKVDAISGLRPGDPRFHGQGLATDVRLTDLASGKMLGNYQDATSFGAYERFAQTARAIQMRDYPELSDQFRWGGYFGGGKGKYGALDTMHFDLAGKRVGMGGGSWENGLTSAQKALWPGIETKGNAAVAALGKVADTSSVAADGLGVLGNGFDKFGNALSSASMGGGSGGGLFGNLLGGLGKMLGGIDPGSAFWAPNSTYGEFIGAFSSGGYTGYGGVHEPAGIVHRGEVVWSQRDVARAGGVAASEALRLGLSGYSSRGPEVAPRPIPVFSEQAMNDNAYRAMARPNVTRQINIMNAPPGYYPEVHEEDDDYGNEKVNVTFSKMAASEAGRPGSPFNKQLRGMGARSARRKM